MILQFTGKNGKLKVVFLGRNCARVKRAVGTIRIVSIIEIDGINMIRVRLLVANFHIPSDLVRLFSQIGRAHV